MDNHGIYQRLDLRELSTQCVVAASYAASRLAELVTPKGNFIYSYKWNNGRQSRNYNLVRHAGSIWSMFLVARGLDSRSRLHNELTSKGMTALGWLLEQHLECIDDTAAIVYKDFFSLGGNSLALLAIAEALSPISKPESKEENEASYCWCAMNIANSRKLFAIGTGLARWNMKQLHSEPGKPKDFHHKVRRSGEIDSYRSDYYTGEALFALLRWSELLHRIRPNDDGAKQVFDEAEAVLSGLSNINYGVEFQSHWMMHAIGAWRQHPLRNNGSKAEATIEAYARVLAKDVIERTAYRARKQATPIACRSEGLLALLLSDLARMDQRTWESDTLTQRALVAVCENILMQLKWLKPDGAVIRGDDSDRVRIDYIQHNITAWWNFARLISLADQKFKPPRAAAKTALDTQGVP